MQFQCYGEKKIKKTYEPIIQGIKRVKLLHYNNGLTNLRTKINPNFQ